jgi:hypothetical protein
MVREKHTRTHTQEIERREREERERRKACLGCERGAKLVDGDVEADLLDTQLADAVLQDLPLHRLFKETENETERNKDRETKRDAKTEMQRQRDKERDEERDEEINRKPVSKQPWERDGSARLWKLTCAKTHKHTHTHVQRERQTSVLEASKRRLYSLWTSSKLRSHLISPSLVSLPLFLQRHTHTHTRTHTHRERERDREREGQTSVLEASKRRLYSLWTSMPLASCGRISSILPLYRSLSSSSLRHLASTERRESTSSWSSLVRSEVCM